MKNILDLDYSEIVELTKKYSQAEYRARQLYDGLQNGLNIETISNLPKAFVQEICQDYYYPLKLIKRVVAVDKTEKYLFELNDSQTIETVYLPNDYGNTLCISTQVGCRMNCKFCASSLNGLIRNLSVGEMLGQVIRINSMHKGTTKKRAISNVVLMGSGEPFDNYDNVVRLIMQLSYEKGLNISKRNISVSTCGLVPKIYSLVLSEASGVTLTISLHATTDEFRRQIMPIANTYTISDIVKAARYYFDKTGRRIIFEYALIKGVNTNHFDVKRLVEITKGLKSHVNLIRLNPVKERNLDGISEEQALKFLKKLNENGVSATLRRRQGGDILGSCGQLRNKFVGDLEIKKDMK